MRIWSNFFDEDFFDSFLRPNTETQLLAKPTTASKKEDMFFGTLADIWEEENKIKAKIDLPGIDKKDIEIKVHDNLIEITAQKKNETKQEGKDFFKYERSFAGYYKAFTLPHKVNENQIDAKYENGVLEITAQKTEKETKRIEVK